MNMNAYTLSCSHAHTLYTYTCPYIKSFYATIKSAFVFVLDSLQLPCLVPIHKFLDLQSNDSCYESTRWRLQCTEKPKWMNRLINMRINQKGLSFFGRGVTSRSEMAGPTSWGGICLTRISSLLETMKAEIGGLFDQLLKCLTLKPLSHSTVSWFRLSDERILFLTRSRQADFATTRISHRPQPEYTLQWVKVRF